MASPTVTSRRSQTRLGPAPPCPLFQVDQEFAEPPRLVDGQTSGGGRLVALLAIPRVSGVASQVCSSALSVQATGEPWIE